MLEIFFKAVVQTIIILGEETWVMTLRMGWALGEFQHRVPQKITGRHPQRLLDGKWEYPPMETGMKEAGFKIWRRMC